MNKFKNVVIVAIAALGLTGVGVYATKTFNKSDINKQGGKQSVDEFKYYSYLENIKLDNVIDVNVISEYAIDISDVKTLYNSHTNVFIGTVDSVDGCSTTIATGKFSSMPNTYGKITVLKNLKGETSNATITYAREGGILSMTEYEKNAPKELIENRKKHREEAGQNNINMDNTYMNYKEENDIDLETGKTYLFFATFIPETGIYQISGAQYGTREILEPSTNKSVFRSLPDESKLQIKDNGTGKYESLTDFINKYFK